MKVEKDNTIVNRVNKTKEIRFPNLQELQEQRAAEFRAEQRAEKQQQKQTEKQQRRAREEQAKLRSYESIMTGETMRSNAEMPASVDDRYVRIFAHSQQ